MKTKVMTFAEWAVTCQSIVDWTNARGEKVVMAQIPDHHQHQVTFVSQTDGIEAELILIPHLDQTATPSVRCCAHRMNDMGTIEGMQQHTLACQELLEVMTHVNRWVAGYVVVDVAR